MKNNTLQSESIVRRPALWLSVVAAIGAIGIRLIPYGVRPPNFAADGSNALFGGARNPWWIAVPLTFASLVISDVLLWKLFGWEPFNPFVYGSFALYWAIGRVMLRKSQSPARIAAASLIGSTLFYLITNFGTWYTYMNTPQQLFPGTAKGLLDNYIFALPYFGFTLAGDLGFAAVLFGAEAYVWALLRAPKEIDARVPEEVAS